MNIIAKDKNGYDHGCLMAPVPDVVFEKIKAISKDISPKDLILNQDNTIHGIESHPHITIFYGVDDEGEDSKDRLSLLLRKLFTRTLRIKLTNEIGYFDHDDKTVAYIKVESEDLETLNKKISKLFPPQSEFEEYTPHLTLAYLKPGKRIKTKFEPIEFETRYLVLSNPDGSTRNIHLDNRDHIYVKSRIIDEVLKENR